MKALNGFLMTQAGNFERLVYVYVYMYKYNVMLESFIGHVCRTLS